MENKAIIRAFIKIITQKQEKQINELGSATEMTRGAGAACQESNRPYRCGPYK